MSRDASGNYSLPAGNPVVSGTTIESTWANNTMNDLAVAMTDSLSRSGNGGMLAPFNFADGTAAAPSMTFTSEPTKGFYSPNTGELGLAIGAVELSKWAASGLDNGVAGTAFVLNVGAATGDVANRFHLRRNAFAVVHSINAAGAGTFSLSDADGATDLQVFLSADKLGATNLYDRSSGPAALRFKTTAVGAEITGTTLKVLEPEDVNVLFNQTNINGGSQVRIRNDIGSGNAGRYELIQTDNTGAFEKYWMVGIRDASVTLYDNGTPMLATIGEGIQIGTSAASGNRIALFLEDNGGCRVGVSSAGAGLIQQYSLAGAFEENWILLNRNADTEYYRNGALRMTLTSAGATCVGTWEGNFTSDATLKNTLTDVDGLNRILAVGHGQTWAWNTPADHLEEPTVGFSAQQWQLSYPEDVAVVPPHTTKGESGEEIVLPATDAVGKLGITMDFDSRKYLGDIFSAIVTLEARIAQLETFH